MLTLEEIQTKLAKRFEGEKISSLRSIPHPFELPNIKEGAEIIHQAINKNKKILIVGDYDADGILSTAIMVHFFHLLDYSHFSFVIPNRFSDGYGISIPLLERFKEAEVIITVDNGITATEVAQYCLERGKTLIITDHHTPKDTLPQALIINPKVSGFVQEDICGAMVAWYFCSGIKVFAHLKLDLTPLLELVGIAIISDVMPLKDLNRVILKKALTLFKTPHFPFSTLLLKKHKKIDEECIGFYIAPLLNASGRMAQADIALSFILSKDLDEAKKHIQALENLNLERKKIQQETQAKLEKNLIITPFCVIAYGEDWHEGVLGILAGKLAQCHQKPAFVLSLKNGAYQGSARSYGNINLLKSLENLASTLTQGLEADSSAPITFGGHSGALGLRISPCFIHTFAQNFTPHFEEMESEDETLGTLHPSLLNFDLLKVLDQFAPYGEGNPTPLFKLPPLPLDSQKIIGKEQNHTLLTFQSPTYKPIKALAFFCTDLELDFEQLRFSITLDSFTHSPMLLVQK